MENAVGVPVDVTACCYTDVYEPVSAKYKSLGKETLRRQRRFGASCLFVRHFHVRTWALGTLRLL